MNIKINHATQKTQRQTRGPTGLCELFLLTVPIEEVACWQYKTVLIIFPLNLQTIAITLDVVKWRGEATKCLMHLKRFVANCNTVILFCVRDLR